MKTVLERLEAGDVLVADGAIGSLLIERGLEPGAPPESVNLTRPDLLVEIGESYVSAGAGIIQANTFGANPLRLAAHGLEGDLKAINESGVEAARKAAGGRAFVCGSCGPTGTILKPYGDTDPEEVSRGYRSQVDVLIDCGVDLLFIETMIDLTEASLAIAAARSVSASIPIVAMMTFDETPRGFFTMMGTDVVTAAGKLEEMGANVVGSNCGNGIEKMVAIAGEFRSATKLPVAIQANAGLPETVDGKITWPESPAFMAARVPDLLSRGVRLVGGCCGTGPLHIRAIREAVDAAAATA